MKINWERYLELVNPNSYAMCFLIIMCFISLTSPLWFGGEITLTRVFMSAFGTALGWFIAPFIIKSKEVLG